MTLKFIMPSLLQTLERSGFVPYRVQFGRPGSSELRALYVSQEVDRKLDPKRSKLDRKSLAGARLKLDRFVIGSWVSVSVPGESTRNADIRGLNGYGKKLFEFRFFEFSPQQRVLGVFPKKDVFLALGLFGRSELDHNWEKYCRRMLAKIKAMGNSPPECLTYDEIEKVISNWGKPL